MSQKIPDIYLQIISYIENRAIHSVISKREIEEAINRVVYRTSPRRRDRIINELENDFKLLKVTSCGPKVPLYVVVINKCVRKQLAKLNGDFPLSLN